MTVIKKLEITSFGKFKDYTLELSDGLNEIRRENEFGKSTITDFLLFVLYGFTRSTAKNASAENNLLLKYLPWNGEPVLSGAAELNADGRFLRAERMQNNGRKTRVALRDASGEEIPLSGEPGEMIFGVDRDTFVRTFLIRQTDVKFSDCASLSGALTNLVTTGDEETSYGAAAKALAAKRGKYLSRQKQQGRIYDLRKRITQLELEEADRREKLNAAQDVTKERERLRAELKETEAERAAVEAEQLPRAKGGDAKRTLDKIAALKAELGESGGPAGELPDESGMADMTRAFTEKERAARAYGDAAARLAAASGAEKAALEKCPAYAQIRANESEYERIVNMKDKLNVPLIAAGAAVTAAGAALMFVNPLFGLIAAAGAILALLGFIFKKKAPGGFGKTRAELLSAYEDFRKYGGAADAASSERESAAAALESAGAARDAADRACAEYTDKYGVTDLVSVTTFAARCAERRQAERRRSGIESELAALPDEEELRSLAALGYSDLTEKEVQERLLALTARRDAIASRLSALDESGERREAAAKELFMTSEELSSRKSELEYCEKRAAALICAEDALEQAYGNISNRFSPIVNESAKRPLTALTGGRYGDVTLGRDFTVRVKADGEYRELAYFSRGTADAVYFAYRFAMCDLVGSKKGLPLILDDPFWSLDGNRLKNAAELMKTAAKERQIILFSARS